MPNMEKVQQKINQGFELYIGDTFSHAFDVWKKVSVFFAGLFLALGFIMGIAVILVMVTYFGGFQEYIDAAGTGELATLLKFKTTSVRILLFVLTVLMSVAFAPITAGTLQVVRNADKGEPFSFGTVFSFYKMPYFKELAVASMNIAILSSGILLVLFFFGIESTAINYVVSILSGILFIYTHGLIIFENMSGVEALKASISLASKKMPTIFVLHLIAYFVAFMGIIGLFIGLLFTMSILITVNYQIYKDTLGFEEDNDSEIDSIGVQ